MRGNAVIVIPSQGGDIAAFEAVARKLSSDVYAGKATILKTKVEWKIEAETYDTKFFTLKGAEFAWPSEEATDLGSFLTISHGFRCDGPNLAYGDGGHQPWGSDGPGCPVTLSEGANDFWKSVGSVLRADGKIILVGCSMGAGTYAATVAALAGKSVYASTGLFGAGDEVTSLKHIKAIEEGKVLPPMKRFGP